MATITKRGNAYMARVRKGGVTKTKTFNTERQAKQWAQSVENQIRRSAAGLKQHVYTITLGELVDAYIREVKPFNPWGRSKEAVLQMFMRDHGDVQLKQITKQWILEYADRRRLSGAKPQTIAPEIAYLGGVLEFGVDDKDLDIDLNHFREAKRILSKRKKIGKSDQRDRLPKEVELQTIVEYFRQSNRMPSQYGDIVMFAAKTAMRLSEICNLRWDDYDAADRTILIRDRKHPTEKLGNNQTVPLLFGSDEILERQPRTSDRVFPHNPKTVSTTFTRTCQKLEIVDLHFHDLRHYGVTRLFEAGLQIQQVALVSGHRDWQQLKRYTQLQARDLHSLIG